MKPSKMAGRLVYYADVRMNRDILANEWDKRIFLSSLEEARTLFRTEIYAFCVLDGRIRLLAGGSEVKRHTIRRMLTSALERYDRETDLIGEKDTIPSDTVVRANIILIEDENDAVNVLRYIHLTPFSEGYAICAQDYWWTSYSTYKGHYNWTLVDTSMIMRYLSKNDSRPEWTLAEFHRRGETLRNPAPSCIRKGEYEAIPLGDEYYTQGNINERFIVHG